jgi:hypothetical protein
LWTKALCPFASYSSSGIMAPRTPTTAAQAATTLSGAIPTPSSEDSTAARATGDAIEASSHGTLHGANQDTKQGSSSPSSPATANLASLLAEGNADVASKRAALLAALSELDAATGGNAAQSVVPPQGGSGPTHLVAGPAAKEPGPERPGGAPGSAAHDPDHPEPQEHQEPPQQQPQQGAPSAPTMGLQGSSELQLAMGMYPDLPTSAENATRQTLHAVIDGAAAGSSVRKVGKLGGSRNKSVVYRDIVVAAVADAAQAHLGAAGERGGLEPAEPDLQVVESLTSTEDEAVDGAVAPAKGGDRGDAAAGGGESALTAADGDVLVHTTNSALLTSISVGARLLLEV